MFIISELIKTKGIVIQVLPSTTFLVQLENSVIIRAYLSGRMRQNQIRVLEGDNVDVELSVYDLEKGRITRRN